MALLNNQKIWLRFIKLSILLVIILVGFSCHKKTNIYREAYDFIEKCSGKIKNQTGLKLKVYGINCSVPREYEIKNGIYNVEVSYWLYKKRNDEISLEEARKIITSATESLLKDFNKDPNIEKKLEFRPFSYENLQVWIHFVDENMIDLGQGIAAVYLTDGKIDYDQFEIYEYTGKFPAHGKKSTILKESYAEALDIVKKQGKGEFSSHESR